jgi:riboflavin synthase
VGKVVATSLNRQFGCCTLVAAMFTGIVQELGLVRSVRPSVLTIEIPGAFRDRIELGGSIAVNGVCLSARELLSSAFVADLSKETTSRTTLGTLRPGQHVNLELPLSPSSGMDGHWVLGHIDAQGRVQALYQEGSGWTLIVDFPTQYRRFIAEKGSVAVEGISLTPYDLDGGSFRCAIIPETYENTVLKERRRGHSVNLEFDILAKYVERMIHFVHSD